MWRSVGLVKTDVSKEHIASIFMVEKSARRTPHQIREDGIIYY
jgi:hypothetical protein